MSYTKPYTYVDGTVVAATDHYSNEESLKVFVNQEIHVVDIASTTLDTTDFMEPRFISPVETIDFCTKTVQGIIELQEPTNRSYFSSTLKNNAQTSASLSNYQAIPNCAVEVIPERTGATLVITVYGYAVVFDNNTVAGNGGAGNGLWDNRILLQRENYPTGQISYISATRNYVFEGALNPASPPRYLGVKDPGGTGKDASRRPFSFTFYTTVLGVRERFTLVVDPKVEIGYINVKSFVSELFYM